jgi:hypothetical protein
MDKKEGSTPKYIRGNTNDTEEGDTTANSHSFEMTARDEPKNTPVSGKNNGRFFGSHFVFFWVGDEPFLTIGPHCKS